MWQKVIKIQIIATNYIHLNEILQWIEIYTKSMITHKNYHSLNFWEKKNVFQKTLRCHYTQFPFWNCKTVKYEKNSETHYTFILIFFPHCLKSQRGKKSWIGSFAFQTNDFFNRFNLGYRLKTLVSVQTNKWISNE